MNTQKIEKLAALMEQQQLEATNESSRKQGFAVACEANRLQCLTSIKQGKKYTKIDVGTSGKLMIDEDGNIFGIKAYGVIHRGKHYGTLDTVEDYYWGDYYPRKRAEQ